MSDDGWLNVGQAAKYIGVGRATAYQMVAAGQLAHHRLGPSGGVIRSRRRDLDADVEAARRGPAPRPEPAAPPTRREYVSIYDHSKPGGPLREPAPQPPKRRRPAG